MFDNIGAKIKKLATVTCWIEIIGSVLTAIIMLAEDEDLFIEVGLPLLIGGPLVAWIGAFFLYGFGQLIENSDKTVEQLLIMNASKKGDTDENPSVVHNVGAVGKANTQTADWTTSKPVSSNATKLATLDEWYREGLITFEEYKEKVDELK